MQVNHFHYVFSTHLIATVNISVALRNLVQAIGSVVLLFLSSWKLTLVMLSVVPVVSISGTSYFNTIR